MGWPLRACKGGSIYFFAQEFCFLKHEHGPPRGSKPAKTDVLLTTILDSLRGGSIDR